MLRMMDNLPKDAVFSELSSPIGNLTLIVSHKGLHAVLMNDDTEEQDCKEIISSLKRSNNHPVMKTAKLQLNEYFAKRRRTFSLPLVLDGTDFQIKAWEQLLKIPYGQTISYSEQSEKLGDIKKVRAIGTANGRNPIAIIVPCHRVIGKNGSLTGYRGGLEIKKYLLDLEKT